MQTCTAYQSQSGASQPLLSNWFPQMPGRAGEDESGPIFGIQQGKQLRKLLQHVKQRSKTEFEILLYTQGAFSSTQTSFHDPSTFCVTVVTNWGVGAATVLCSSPTITDLWRYKRICMQCSQCSQLLFPACQFGEMETEGHASRYEKLRHLSHT